MSADELDIREALDDELDVVASLVVDAYAEYAAHMSPDAWSGFAVDIANVRGRMADAELLVALREDRIVGSVTRYADWRGAQPGTSAVRLLAIPPEVRGTGVGEALLRHAVEESRSEGKRRVVMTAMDEMDYVRQCAARLGFERDFSLDHEPAPGVKARGYALEVQPPAEA